MPSIIKADFKVTCICSMFMCFDFPASFLCQSAEMRRDSRSIGNAGHQIASIRMHLSSVDDRKKISSDRRVTNGHWDLCYSFCKLLHAFLTAALQSPCQGRAAAQLLRFTVPMCFSDDAWIYIHSLNE